MEPESGARRLISPRGRMTLRGITIERWDFARAIRKWPDALSEIVAWRNAASWFGHASARLSGDARYRCFRTRAFVLWELAYRCLSIYSRYRSGHPPRNVGGPLGLCTRYQKLTWRVGLCTRFQKLIWRAIRNQR